MKISEYKTVWIDLTDFVDWQGHFTGIQRVEYELASRFSKLNNVKFFFYHPIKSSFSEIGFDAIEQKAKIASGEVKVSEKEMQRQIKISKRLVKKFKESIPHDTRMKLVKIKGKIKNINEKNPFEPTHPFTDHDIVLVLGGNWAFSTFMPTLDRVKKSVNGLKSVHVIYDMIPVLHPGFFPEAMEESYAEYIQYVLKYSDFSLAISENTKSDAELYASKKGIINKSIETFRLGEDFVKIRAEKPDVEGLKSSEFLFCVGTLEIRKNHQLLYNAYKLAAQKGINLPKIVIVGKKGWLTDSTIHTLELDPDVRDKVIMLNKCSDKEMAWLYENCLFTVYPSYYEGWGLPIAESLHYGKMCLSSNTSSMPEVAGDIIDYFSPFDSGELLEKIIQYLDNKNLKSAENNINDKYKTTSWDDAYKQVVKLIEKNC